MTRVWRAAWRAAWREQQDAAPPIERTAHRDTREQAEALADEVVRGGRVLGQVVIWDFEVEGVGA